MSRAAILTGKDAAILEVMLERLSALGDPLVPALERKLASARIVPRDTVPANLVTLNSRVAFQVDGVSDTRILVQADVRGFVGMTIPLGTPRGLTLLGLVPHQPAVAPLANGRAETLVVDEVLFQPEAAQRQAAPRGVQQQSRHTFPVLVHSAPLRKHLALSTISDDNGDDPGPAAA